MIWILESVVIFLTFTALMLGVAWWQERGKRVPVERMADPAPLPGELPRAGRLALPAPNAGAADPAQRLAPVPWDLAGAAYALGQHRKDQDEITRQVDAIMLEVELHPERWGER